MTVEIPARHTRSQHELFLALDRAAKHVAAVTESLGWYEDDRTFGDDIALLHSEVSEALEAFRDHGYDDPTDALCAQAKPALHGDDGHLCKPEGVGAELADVFIRLLDTCYRRGIDLADEFERKVAYNQTRLHRHGGKRL